VGCDDAGFTRVVRDRRYVYVVSHSQFDVMKLGINFLFCVTVVGLLTACGESKVQNGDAEFPPGFQNDHFVRTLADSTFNLPQRKEALRMLVDANFGSDAGNECLLRVLGELGQLREFGYEIVPAFAGSWPLDESLSMMGNTLLVFRFRWEADGPASIVYVLINGRRTEAELQRAFNGRLTSNEGFQVLDASLLEP
jgi:hypothetical protein